jgi:hypothetical protein
MSDPFGVTWPPPLHACTHARMHGALCVQALVGQLFLIPSRGQEAGQASKAGIFASTFRHVWHWHPETHAI